MLATRKFHLYEVHQRIVMPDSLILSRISQSNFVYSRTGKVESLSEGDVQSSLGRVLFIP